VQYKTRFGRHGRQPVDGRLRFLQVGVCPSAQQGFDQNGGGRPTKNRVAGGEFLLEGSPRQFDRAIEIAASGLLLDDRTRDCSSRCSE
jgi:hypothetical protein